MTLALNDRVKETTTVTGTGTATLLGATTGFQSFAVIGNANTTYYCIADQGGANWEVGIGTYTASGTTLARTTVLASSNAGALVVFTTGVKDVFVTYPSEKGVWYDASGNVLFTGTTTATNLAYTGTLTGSTGILNIGSGQVYKDASGNVGIGTSSPSAKLNAQGFSTYRGNSYVIASFCANSILAPLNITQLTDGTIPAISAGQSSGGAWNSLGFMTSNAEAMRIDTYGNLLVGTTAAQSGVYNDPVGITLMGSSANGVGIFARNSLNSVLYVNNKVTSGSPTLIQFNAGGLTSAVIGSITYSGSLTLYNTTSDQRLKTNIIDAPSALASVNAIKVRSFDWKSTGEHQEYGYIAQELLEVVPEAVHIPFNEDEMMSVDFGKLTPRLVKAIQEQQTLIEALTSRLTALEAK